MRTLDPTMHLVSYIAPAAPATRRPATGDEPFVRAEIGFTPRWYHDALGIDFGKCWHTDPAYRRDTIAMMARELRRRFPETGIGWVDDPDRPSDLLTGAFGACPVAAIYGVPIIYAPDRWPASAPRHITDAEADSLRPPDLGASPFVHSLMGQIDWIARENGRVEGYLNWQGVLNNAYRLRGEEIFTDMAAEPARASHVFECITITMTEAARLLYARQRETGVVIRHFTISNCLVNMVSPDTYRDLLLPFDRRIAEAFGPIGIHNCAWNADPYNAHYATLPQVAYIDMGIESNLAEARELFPDARRAIMYGPVDAADKTRPHIQVDLRRIARDYGPCDVVFADIEAGAPDERIRDLVRLCAEVSETSDGNDTTWGDVP